MAKLKLCTIGLIAVIVLGWPAPAAPQTREAATLDAQVTRLFNAGDIGRRYRRRSGYWKFRRRHSGPTTRKSPARSTTSRCLTNIKAITPMPRRCTSAYGLSTRNRSAQTIPMSPIRSKTLLTSKGGGPLRRCRPVPTSAGNPAKGARSRSSRHREFAGQPG